MDLYDCKYNNNLTKFVIANNSSTPLIEDVFITKTIDYQIDDQAPDDVARDNKGEMLIDDFCCGNEGSIESYYKFGKLLFALYLIDIKCNVLVNDHTMFVIPYDRDITKEEVLRRLEKLNKLSLSKKQQVLTS